MDHVTHEPLSWGSYILFLDFSSYLFSTNTKGFFFINLRMWVVIIVFPFLPVSMLKQSKFISFQAKIEMTNDMLKIPKISN